MRTDQSPLQAACWASAERLEEFDARELSAAAEVGYDTATTWLRRWHRAGRVTLIGKGEGGRKRWRVAEATERVAPAAPNLPASPAVNMWRTIRALRTGFKPTDIAAHSTAGAVAVSKDEASAYCQMLTRAGYLRVERKAQPGVREAIYRLVKDTGPRPPRERRMRVVWDENERRIAHLPGGDA